MIPLVNVVKQLDLVALVTVCSFSRLTGLNRSFVSSGLEVAATASEKRTKNLGYNALCNVTNTIQKDITFYHLRFVLGPRVNAGNRVGKSSLGITLTFNNISS